MSCLSNDFIVSRIPLCTFCDALFGKFGMRPKLTNRNPRGRKNAEKGDCRRQGHLRAVGIAGRIAKRPSFICKRKPALDIYPAFMDAMVSLAGASQAQNDLPLNGIQVIKTDWQLVMDGAIVTGIHQGIHPVQGLALKDAPGQRLGGRPQLGGIDADAFVELPRIFKQDKRIRRRRVFCPELRRKAVDIRPQSVGILRIVQPGESDKNGAQLSFGVLCNIDSHESPFKKQDRAALAKAATRPNLDKPRWMFAILRGKPEPIWNTDLTDLPC